MKQKRFKLNQFACRVTKQCEKLVREFTDSELILASTIRKLNRCLKYKMYILCIIAVFGFFQVSQFKSSSYASTQQIIFSTRTDSMHSHCGFRFFKNDLECYKEPSPFVSYPHESDDVGVLKQKIVGTTMDQYCNEFGLVVETLKKLPCIELKMRRARETQVSRPDSIRLGLYSWARLTGTNIERKGVSPTC